MAGGDPVELAGEGVFLDHDERYELTDEFLKIWRRLFIEEEVDLQGDYFRLKGDNFHTLRSKNRIHRYPLEDLHLLRWMWLRSTLMSI